MILEKEYWDYKIHANVEKIELFFEEEEEKLKALNTTEDLWFQKWI